MSYKTGKSTNPEEQYYVGRGSHLRERTAEVTNAMRIMSRSGTYPLWPYLPDPGPIARTARHIGEHLPYTMKEKGEK